MKRRSKTSNATQSRSAPPSRRPRVPASPRPRVSASPTRVPISTYRIQFNKEFTFRDALQIVPYLHQLGISDLYASPIFMSRPGSPHGYDVVDPTRLDPELGSEKDFEELI